MTILLCILSALLSSNINFKTLPIEESGTNINTICQDSLGRIWLGGNDGIIRYDGNRFEHFSHNIRSGHHIPDNSVYNIVCDTLGIVWVAHISGLSKYDSESNSFKYYPTPSGALSELVILPSGSILTIAGDRLWIFDRESGKFSRGTIPDLLFMQNVTTIASGREKIFIGTKNGRLFSCSKELGHVSEINTSALSSNVTCMLNDTDSHLWVGTEGDGLWEISINENTCTRFVDSKTGKASKTDIIKTLCTDDSGTLWVGTKKGLKILSDGHLNTFYHDNSSGSLPHDSVGAILSDRQGTMWLGTYYGGVCYYCPSSSSFRRIVLSSASNKVHGHIISDIVEDPDGAFWIGTNSNGLIHMSPDGEVSNIASDTGEDNQLDVKAIYISPYSNRIYIGADRSELFVCYRRSKRLHAVPGDSPKSCYAIEYNNKDGFYIGTFDGLYEYNERVQTFSRIYFTGDNTNIKSLKLDSHGILWIGKKSGITAINKDDAKILDLPESLASVKYAEIIMEDSRGIIWIGSRYGLYSYDPRSGSVGSYTEKDGLPHHVIHGIEEDRNGVLWISTDRGLCRFSPSTGDKLTFTTSDGLLDNRFTTYAHCRTKEGMLYFGSINGIVMFDPANISVTRATLPPVICGIEVNGIWNGIPDEKVVLAPNERSITFMFSSPDFISEKNGRFYYKLEGFDKEWNMANTDWRASFQNLPHGDYTFKVRYVDSSGKESQDVESIHLRIRAHWYKTTAAVIAYIFIVIFLVAMLINWLVSRKEMTYKSKMDEFRNKILRDFSLEFRNQNSSDETKTEMPRNFDESDEKFMRHAMKIVRENMDNASFSVDDFAKAMFMSRSNLNLKVKALFGVAPLELIKTVRFNEACRLLQEKKHTMTEISEMVGFTTSSYFTSAFKRFIGCTPSEYLKKNC